MRYRVQRHNASYTWHGRGPNGYPGCRPGELLLRVRAGKDEGRTAAPFGEQTEQLTWGHVHADAAAVGGGDAVTLKPELQPLQR